MTTPSSGLDITDSQISPRRSGLAWWQAIAAGVAATTALNLVVLLIARAAGATMVVRQPGAADQRIDVAGVVLSSVVPLTAGTLLAAGLALWWSGFLRLAQVIGGGVGVVSAAGPLLSDADAATRVALAVMHVVVGVAVVVILEAIRRRRVARSDRA